ncbi:MAG: PDC sensor domain-containing protein, partial [bacterium]
MISGKELKKKGVIFLNSIFMSNHPIIIIGIIAAILLIFVILSIYTQSKDNIITEFQKHQLTSVESAAHGIEGFIREIIKDLRILSELRSGHDEELPMNQSSLNNLYSLHQQGDSFLVSLSYFDNQRNLRLAAPALDGKGENKKADHLWGKGGITLGSAEKLHISRLFFNEKAEGRVRISIPVFDGGKKQESEEKYFLGALAADIDI